MVKIKQLKTLVIEELKLVSIVDIDLLIREDMDAIILNQKLDALGVVFIGVMFVVVHTDVVVVHFKVQAFVE